MVILMVWNKVMGIRRAQRSTITMQVKDTIRGEEKRRWHMKATMNRNGI